MVKKDSKRAQVLKKNARRRSIGDGIFTAAKTSFGDYYIAPFAIAINASNSMVALLSSVTGMLGPLSQMFGSKFIGKYSRKEIVVKSVFYELLMWVPIIAIAILFYEGVIVNALPLFLLLFFSFYIILANISTPAWFSWLGDLVGEKYRGIWFAKRNLLVGFIAVSFAILAAYFLDYFTKKGWIMFGFIILFFMAFVARTFALKMLKKMYEPKLKLKKGDYFSFFEFLSKAKENNFGKFAIFRALLSFSTFIYWPFITIYLLRYLEFNYLTYMVITLAGTVLSLLVLELWGKFADKYGNYKVMYITTVLIPIVPILWILYPNPLYLIFVPSMINGISWAGFNLAVHNFIYDNVSPQKRGFAVSYFNVLYGVGVFLGAGLGALLIKFLKVDFIEPLFLLFFIGSITSMIVVAWWMPKIKEIRKTEKSGVTRAIGDMIFKEARPTLIQEAHEIISIKKYLRE